MSKLLHAVLMAGFVLTSYPHAASADAGIDKRLQALISGWAGCTAARKELRKLRKQYPQYTFAFAGRKGTTITGIKGCGYGYDKSAKKARAAAMTYCLQWEKKYGTEGGTKTCSFVD